MKLYLGHFAHDLPLLRGEFERRLPAGLELVRPENAELYLASAQEGSDSGKLPGDQAGHPRRESDPKARYLLYYGSSEALGHSTHVIVFSLVPPIHANTVVELRCPLQTPRAELEKAHQFFRSLGFETVEVPDTPGGIAARVVACLANEAISALHEGVADMQTLDTAMKLGTSYPLGPLEWADLWGLENVLSVLEGLFDYYGEDRYRPHPLLKKLVHAGMTVREYDALRSARADEAQTL